MDGFTDFYTAEDHTGEQNQKIRKLLYEYRETLREGKNGRRNVIETRQPGKRKA